LQIAVEAPTRIDLAGGTLDLWPIHHVLKSAMTVNAAISLHARAEIETAGTKYIKIHSKDQNAELAGEWSVIAADTSLPLLSGLVRAIWRPEFPGFTLTTSAKSPAGAGIGGSSCLGIACATALWDARRATTGEQPLDEPSLVRLVQNVEAKVIHAPTGVQDYWGAVRGGVNVISFPARGDVVRTFSNDTISGMKESVIICYSGKSRASALNNWSIFKKTFDRDGHFINRLETIGSLAEQAAAAVEKGSLDQLLKFSHLEWQQRIALWPDVETAETKRLDRAAVASGAYFSRVCGAGGGGVMAVFVPPERRSAVTEALVKNEGVVLPAELTDTGLKRK
jgi:D-glycero-alpha-D-manno-heptose-7-phosphate kinase